MTRRCFRQAALLLAALGVAFPGVLAAQPAALDEAMLEAWLAGYETAWESRDAEAAAALFTAEARYFETPYAEPFAGRDAIAAYWSEVTADQREIDFEAEIVAVEGRIGVARWTAEFLAGPEDARVALDGIFVLEFAAGGLCNELREWWHMRPDSD